MVQFGLRISSIEDSTLKLHRLHCAIGTTKHTAKNSIQEHVISPDWNSEQFPVSIDTCAAF